MDFLKENKDGGKVRGPPSTRRVCIAHHTLKPRTPSALPYASVQVVNERGEMRLEDLPPPLVNEIRSTQRRYQEELDAMSSDPYGLQFQALLQAPSHSARLDIFSKIIGEEQKRLAAREQLKSMFKGVGDS